MVIEIRMGIMFCRVIGMMNKINRYEIWQAKVYYEDEEGFKDRPVLIWNDAVYVLCYKMTGTNRGDNKEEFRLRYWKESGLTKETSIRISKLLKLEKTDLLYKIGVLDPRDQLRFELRVVP